MPSNTVVEPAASANPRFLNLQDDSWYHRQAVAGGYQGAGGGYLFCKRGLDLAVCLFALPVVLVLIFLCALTIRWDSPGPIFILQQRTGRNGKRFTMYKLRTRFSRTKPPAQNDGSAKALGVVQRENAGDPRVTPAGRFLRKTSLDELPQIFNVLKGEMSLVGPRPTSFNSESHNLWRIARLQCKPGLTGLWQVCGRNDLDFDERVRLDVAYMRNQSMWLDVQILFRTVGAILTGRGAD